MDVTEVVEGDTHPIWFTVRDKFGVPLDITGATAVGWAKRRGLDPVPLALSIEGNPTEGKWRHDLTGLLAPGTYTVKIKMLKAGVQTTAPTSKDAGECLQVNPSPGGNQ